MQKTKKIRVCGDLRKYFQHEELVLADEFTVSVPVSVPIDQPVRGGDDTQCSDDEEAELLETAA